MDVRVVQFIAGLRAAGVRISLAESQDAFLAVQHLGVMDRGLFHSALRSTLVKERADQPIFDRLFPMFFSSGGPPFIPPDEALSPEDQKKLAESAMAMAKSMQQSDKMSEAMQQASKGMSQEEIGRAHV